MTDTDATKWQQLAEQSRSGELYLDDEAVARECLKACDDRLTDLGEILNLARLTQRVSGFGDFDMGHALEGGYKLQATGDPNSIDQVILENIETVKNMREVMALSIQRLTGEDVDNAARISSADPGS